MAPPRPRPRRPAPRKRRAEPQRFSSIARTTTRWEKGRWRKLPALSIWGANKRVRRRRPFQLAEGRHSARSEAESQNPPRPRSATSRYGQLHGGGGSRDFAQDDTPMGNEARGAIRRPFQLRRKKEFAKGGSFNLQSERWNRRRAAIWKAVILRGAKRSCSIHLGQGPRRSGTANFMAEVDPATSRRMTRRWEMRPVAQSAGPFNCGAKKSSPRAALSICRANDGIAVERPSGRPSFCAERSGVAASTSAKVRDVPVRPTSWPG